MFTIIQKREPMSLGEEPTDVPRLGGGGARRVAVALGALAVVLGPGLAGPAAPGRPSAQEPAETRPNVLVVMTDDQTVAQMRAMPRVRARVARRGTRFANSFVNYPLCCPSRATFLTGQYTRNHGVKDNHPPEGGFYKLDSNETLAVWLQRAGYYTGHVGKTLNSYGRDGTVPVPPGWAEWFAPAGATVDDVYEYDVSDSGTLVHYGSAPEDFKQDVISERALDFVERRAPLDEPFFLFVGYTAPHFAGPEPSPQPPAECEGEIPKPAPRHAGAFAAELSPQPPSFNEADVSDKPPDVAALPPLTEDEVAEVGRAWRCALEALLSVDEGVGRMLGALRRAGELESTLIVFTSDNGFFFGEHRIASGKKRLYEEAARVPLAIRGPGFLGGGLVRELVSNTDLAPTILEAAGARPGLEVDGRSLLGLARDPGLLEGRELLIESNRYDAVRTWRFVYAEHEDGSREMYDMWADPFQLESVHADPAYRRERRELARRLVRLRRCAGERCHAPPALKLHLLGADGEDGGRCLTAPVRALVGHADEPVALVAFRVNGRPAGMTGNAPFRRRLPGRLLARQQPALVQATVDMVDGRRAALIGRATICA